MRKPVLVVAIAALLAMPAMRPQAASGQEANSIQGAWVFTDAEGQVRGLFIFTASNYSQMYVRGGDQRAVLPENTTTEQRLASMDEVTANSGRYALEGDQLTYEAYMAKNAAYMSGWPDNVQTVTVTVDGDTMTWIAGNNTFTLRRVG
jgi:hypothetical protein